ncbi:MAG: DJ-1/PfpI family protein [Candidatus Thorarchaeota archaeon]
MKKVIILAGDFVDDYELMVPYVMLNALGYKVDVVSPGRIKGDRIKTVIHAISNEDWKLLRRGKPVTYSESLGHPFTIGNGFDWEKVEQEAKKYDGLIIPGGRAPEYLSLIPDVRKLVIEFMKEDKPIGAICHGPQILATTAALSENGEYLKGKKMCPYPSIVLECSLLGAKIKDDYPPNIAITDGNLVTAPSWLALPEFMKQFLELLK